MTGVLVRTCAKVNLCLRVLGRRTDGYHEVQTVMQAISLWDCIGLRSGSGGSAINLRLPGGGAPGDDSNTCWQAARLIAEQAGISAGVTIELHKSIPAGAGLGGGSSDAAATLAGLARLWDAAVEPRLLESMAAQIGADVPFFLRGGCCLARGRGEKLKPLPAVSMWLVVVVPEERVPTAEAYTALHRPVGAPSSGRRLSRPVQRMVAAARAGDPALVAEALHNDFETVDLPGIAAARRAKQALLSAGCLGAGVSGSGSAAFGIAVDFSRAQAIATALKKEWPWVQVARTLQPQESMVISSLEEEAV